MIEIEVDFNHADGRGRLLLADLVAHLVTPFADIAASGDRILFVDGNEFVEGGWSTIPSEGGSAQSTGIPRTRSRPIRATCVDRRDESPRRY